MKRLLCILLAVALLLCLPGCGKGTTLKDIQKAGVLKVAIGDDCYPYLQRMEDSSLRGIERDVLSVISDSLNVELDIQIVDPDDVLTGVADGTYDLGAGGLSSTLQVDEAVLFTEGYAVATQTLLTTVESTVLEISELAKDGILAVHSYSTAEKYCNTNGYQSVSYPTYNDMLEAVKNGDVDGALVDSLIASHLVSENNATSEQRIKWLTAPVFTDAVVFALAQGSDALADHIDLLVANMLAEGTLHAIYESYGMTYTSTTA